MLEQVQTVLLEKYRIKSELLEWYVPALLVDATLGGVQLIIVDPDGIDQLCPGEHHWSFQACNLEEADLVDEGYCPDTTTPERVASHAITFWAEYVKDTLA